MRKPLMILCKMLKIIHIFGISNIFTQTFLLVVSAMKHKKEGSFCHDTNFPMVCLLLNCGASSVERKAHGEAD